MVRVLLTGSRDYTDKKAIEVGLAAVLQKYKTSDIILVHGGCPTGADAIAHKMWIEAGYDVEVHPAEWDKYGKSAGPMRNIEMVDAGADICLAYPRGESRGTRQCMNAARKAGIPVYVNNMKLEEDN